jgi:transcriptional regulator with XRE-family HTH domain
MGIENMTPLAKHIEMYLTYKGKSISQFCRDAGIPVPTLSRFLKGERGLTPKNIRKLAAAAGENSDDWLLLAGIREEGGVSVTSGLTKQQIDNDFPATGHSPTDNLELSDKIARLTPESRALVEGVVDLMLAQNSRNKKTHR